MDWVQVMTGVAAGATAAVYIQKLLKDVGRSPDKPVRNGERRSILGQLAELKDLFLEMNSSLGNLQDDVRGINRRVLKLERGPEGRSASNSGSTD